MSDNTIDLGVELDGYDGKPKTVETQPWPSPCEQCACEPNPYTIDSCSAWRPGPRNIGRLADLQAQGFNTNPRAQQALQEGLRVIRKFKEIVDKVLVDNWTISDSERKTITGETDK